MQNTLRVRVVEGGGHGRQHLERIRDRHDAVEAVRQRASVHELANDVGHAFLFPVGEHGEDVVVSKLGNRDRFDLEANPVVLVLGEEIGQDLDRYVAGKGLLISLVDRGHASAAYLLDDQIRTYSRPRANAQPYSPSPTVPARHELFSSMNDQVEPT